MCGIYKITNLVNNKIYIGKSKNIEKRWKQHIDEAYHGSQRLLCKAIRKYKECNFSFQIIESIPIEKYDKISSSREIYWIAYYDSYKQGYNMTPGGDGGSVKGIHAGLKSKQAKLTKEDIIDIRTDYKNLVLKQDSYKKYKDKISLATFSRVWNNQTYKEIMQEVYTTENKAIQSRRQPPNKNGAKLKEKQVIEIRKLYKQGIGITELSKQYKVAYMTIYKIINYITWKDI